ncbi:TonB-dependent receptor [Larkinella harenae]
MPNQFTIQLWKFMRFTAFQLCLMLLFAGLTYAADSNAQEFLNQRVSLDCKDLPVKTVLRNLEKTAHVQFLYSVQRIQANRKISFEAQNEKLGDVLERLLKPLEISYEISGQQIVLSRSGGETGALPTEAGHQQVAGTKTVEQTVSGRVIDEKGEGIPGVNVVLKGTTRGTTTDVDGNYKLVVPDASSILIFSFVGYLPQEVTVGNQTTVNISLQADNKSLEEVVVIGYGTQKKKDLTGAVNSLDNTKNEVLPNTNITQALRGMVPGVSITAGGNAGSGSEIRIRGQNSLTGSNNALIVVDGIIYNGQLGNLNPNDIASIDILKDASSAAIFGARAANGVVLVTTKKGTTEKPTIQFNSYAGMQDFLMTQDLETPEQYIQKRLNYQKTLAFRKVAPEPNLNNPVQYLNADEVDNFERGITVDPLKRITQPAPIQSYNLNIGAKTARTNYYIAGSWTDQQGRVMGDQFKRASIRVNLETKVTDWLKFGTNSSLSFVDVSGAKAELSNAFRLSPYARWYLDSAQTTLNPIPMTDGLVGNPLMPLLNTVTNQRRDLFGIFYGEISVPFIEGLTYRFTYSNNIITQKNYQFIPSFNAGGLNRVGSASDAISESQDMFLENLVKYNRTFANDHNVDVTLLYNYNYAKADDLTANSNTFPTDVLNYYGLNLGTNQTTNAGFSDYRAIAMMARLNYKFKDRYLLTLTGRRDGASLFSANHKYAFFPSMALGWVISEESFLKDATFVDFLKLRLSYGANGNLATGRYQSLSRIEPNTGYNYLFGGQTAFGIAKTSMGNPDLKWESTYAMNLGLDFDVLKGRISGSVNYYNSDTKDLLINRTIPTLNGFSNILSNLGAVNNKGIEISLNTVNIQRSGFEWNTGLNFARNVNKIVRLYGTTDENGRELDDLSNRWFIGKSIGAYYNYTTDGIWQIGETIPAGFRPGDYRIKDLNGDGKITPDDRSIIGYNVPAFTFGFNNTLRYRGFSLFAQVSGSVGGVRDNGSILNPASSFTYRVRDRYIDWWTPENPSNRYPSMDYQNSYGINWLENPSYVRIQDVSLNYDFAKALLSKLKMTRLQVYVSAKNPVLFTNWSGWDPETTGSGRTQYPTMKSYILGINLGL